MIISIAFTVNSGKFQRPRSFGSLVYIERDLSDFRHSPFFGQSLELRMVFGIIACFCYVWSDLGPCIICFSIIEEPSKAVVSFLHSMRDHNMMNLKIDGVVLRAVPLLVEETPASLPSKSTTHM